VPWYVKIFALAVAGYALSSIDLIPDFIPVLGQLDDLMIVPLGIWLVMSLIPNEIMAEYRAMANETAQRPTALARRSSSLRFGFLGRRGAHVPSFPARQHAQASEAAGTGREFLRKYTAAILKAAR